MELHRPRRNLRRRNPRPTQTRDRSASNPPGTHLKPFRLVLERDAVHTVYITVYITLYKAPCLWTISKPQDDSPGMIVPCSWKRLCGRHWSGDGPAGGTLVGRGTTMAKSSHGICVALMLNPRQVPRESEWKGRFHPRSFGPFGRNTWRPLCCPHTLERGQNQEKPHNFCMFSPFLHAQS